MTIRGLPPRRIKDQKLAGEGGRLDTALAGDTISTTLRVVVLHCAPPPRCGSCMGVAN